MIDDCRSLLERIHHAKLPSILWDGGYSFCLPRSRVGSALKKWQWQLRSSPIDELYVIDWIHLLFRVSALCSIHTKKSINVKVNECIKSFINRMIKLNYFLILSTTYHDEYQCK